MGPGQVWAFEMEALCCWCGCCRLLEQGCFAAMFGGSIPFGPQKGFKERYHGKSKPKSKE